MREQNLGTQSISDIQTISNGSRSQAIPVDVRFISRSERRKKPGIRHSDIIRKKLLRK